ncbi:MAG: ATP-binding cassette domain-containing protein [Anaerolineae bacterium]|nr:ATP-binding cassette domain-containing protein [Anaerolineae bacterium]
MPTNPPGQQTLVTLKDVVLQQDGLPASQPLNWAIRPGEQWAIVGPINSGKRLLAQTLAGQIPPLQGQLLWGGGHHRSPCPDGGAARPLATGVACVYVTFDRPPSGDASFHQARWHAGLAATSPTVAESLSFSGIWHRNPFEISRDPAQPEELAQFQRRQAGIVTDLRLAPLLERQLHQLSDGEWRRLQIGRALLRSPRLLILDHPLAGLDKAYRPQLDRVLARLAEQTAMQVLLLSASLAELLDVTSHVLVMEDGRISAQGKKEEISRTYLRSTQAAPDQAQREPLPVDRAGERVPAPVLVHLDNVNIVHNGVQVLERVTWTVRQGEKWALVGPNGAGKSTLLSLILGDHPQAYANEIELFGRPRGSGESIWEIKRYIGWVAPELQRYHPPEVRALDIVCSGYFDALGLNRAATDSQRAFAEAWMDRLAIGAARDTPFYRLSQGEKRLTLIARALVKNPKLLVLDEPCQGLDPAHLAAVLEALREVTADPERTLIYVTHHPREFPRGLTHILELAGGRVVRQEPVTPAGF